jgi:hypothetical protein
MSLHDSFGDCLTSLLEDLWNPDNGDVADDVIRFVEKLKLPRFKLVCKKRLQVFSHRMSSMKGYSCRGNKLVRFSLSVMSSKPEVLIELYLL